MRGLLGQNPINLDSRNQNDNLVSITDYNIINPKLDDDYWHNYYQ